jgi:uncharacterized iron-regulated membrane protein
VALCVVGLSGSILVFRPELERWSHPELFHVRPAGTPVTIAEMEAVARSEARNLQLYRVKLPQNDHSSYEFIFGVGGLLTQRVYVDPYEARVLGTRTAGSDFFLWLQALHFDLLAGTWGRQLNGVVAAVELLLGLTGLTLWLGLNASWPARLRPRWRVRPARRNWGLHVAAGFWGLPFLLLMGSTAIYFAFHEPVAHFIYAVTRTAAPTPVRSVQSGPVAVPLDVLLLRAQALERAGEFTLIRLPRAPSQPVTFNYVLPGDLSDLGANGIHFDASTGRALRIDRVRDMQLGPRVVAALVPLHFGTFGRTPTRVLWASLGVLPSLLFMTGLAIWWRRRWRRTEPEAMSPAPDLCESLLEVRKS